MKIATFEIGKHYAIGTPEHNVQPTVECIKRTAKFVTLLGASGEYRVKINNYTNNSEGAVYFVEQILATQECKSSEEQIKECDDEL